MNRLLATIRVGLLDMRGDWRRFALLIVCLAIGTALVAGVSLVGASLRQAIERDAALLMGGSLELSRADRLATAAEVGVISGYGEVAMVVDSNVRAETFEATAFVDLIAVGEGYPLLGRVDSPQLPEGSKPLQFLEERDGQFGALVDPLMLDSLGAAVGDTVSIGGTDFEVRGILRAVPDAPVRGLRLGSPALISLPALAELADRTSPLPGLGNVFRYKLLLADGDPEVVKDEIALALGDAGWQVRSARDGLGDMVRYYDLFMRFLVVVGLVSLFVGGVSVWTVISTYIGERTITIATMRSLGASRRRVLGHFLAQVGTLAVIGVGIGLLIGGIGAAVAMPIVGAAAGVPLSGSLEPVPLLVAGAAGLVVAFAFSYLPLTQGQMISPATLFRSKGVGADPVPWQAWLSPGRLAPLVIALALFFWLASIMTNDPVLVAGFGIACAAAVVLLRLVLAGIRGLVRRLPEARWTVLRRALKQIDAPGSSAPAVVVSVGLALTMLTMVLSFELNLRNEYLGASAFDAPTFVAPDLFDDEVELLQALGDSDAEIRQVTAVPMLRGTVAAVNGAAATTLRPRGPAASFLLSGEIPLAYRRELPTASRIVAGSWWPKDYTGDPLVSLHQDLRSGLGVGLGDQVTFSIFGDQVTATVASFRDYSWQGGIDVLVTFSPGVIEEYPLTLLGAVTTVAGREDAVQLRLADELPDVRFIPIGETLQKITLALQQLSLAASIVGGVAVANGLLVLIGSLLTGRKQRQADAVVMRVIGVKVPTLVGTALLEHVLLALVAAVVAVPLGIGLAWFLTALLLEVEFALPVVSLVSFAAVALLLSGALGATTIMPATRPRPALFLRQLTAE